MNERETAGRLNELRTSIYNSYGWSGADNLEDAIRDALRIEPPPGKPDEFAAASESVGKAAINVDNAQNAVKKLRTMVLPAAWSGEASVSASAALKALERIFERAGDTFFEAKRVFADHGQDLSAAHTTDKRGVGPLEAAHRLYDEGRAGSNLPKPGLTPEMAGNVANEHVAPATGVHYDNQRLDDADARREALRKAEEAVDRGVPVPFNTKTHEMVIVGHDGDRIQIFNPAGGYTIWITEQEFINNTGGLGGGTPPIHMRVPK